MIPDAVNIHTLFYMILPDADVSAETSKNIQLDVPQSC